MARSFAALRLSWLVMIALDRDRRITDFTVRVATVLADYLNEKNGAWPSLETLARVLEASTEGVRIALVKLEGCGYLTAERARGRGKTNVYRMAFPMVAKPQQPLASNGAENPNGDRTMRPTAIGKKPQQRLAQNLKKGTERREPDDPTLWVSSSSDDDETNVRDVFDQLFARWPKRSREKEARKRFAALVLDSPERLVAILEGAEVWLPHFNAEISASGHPQYVVNLATWLEEERWLHVPEDFGIWNAVDPEDEDESSKLFS